MKVRNSFLSTLCISACIALGTAGSASAALTTYVGEDLIFSAAPPPAIGAPNSLAAANAFAAATGPTSLITFEGAALGAFGSLGVAPGVTLTGGGGQSIRNTTNFPAYPSVDGFNTTAGGSYFVELQGGSLTFTFLKPINAFGVYLSGVQTNFFADSVNFIDAGAQSIVLKGIGTSCCVGELAFVGFRDLGASITSVTIMASAGGSADFIGVDDVRFQTVGVPEPATWAMMLLGFGGVGAAIRSRRRMAIALA